MPGFETGVYMHTIDRINYNDSAIGPIWVVEV